MNTRLLKLLVAFLALATPGWSTTVDWRSTPADSVWATGANWVGGTAPANSLTLDIARFDQPSYANQPDAGTTSVAGIQIGDGTTATAGLTLSGTQLAIGASGISMFANAGAADIATGVTLGASQVWANNSSVGLTVSGSVSGAYGLAKAGTGTVILAGSNTYTGDTTVSSGTLRIASISAIPNGTGRGNLSVNSSSTLDLSGLSITVNGLSGGTASGRGTVTNTSATPAILTMGDGDATAQYDGWIKDGAGTVGLVKIGTGTQTITGATGNTFTGGITLTAGVLAFTNSALGLGGPLRMDGGILRWSPGANTDVSGRLVLVSGKVAWFDTAGDSVNFAQAISGAATAVVKTGSAMLTVSGASTYAAPTEVRNGTLSLNARNNCLPVGTTVTLGDGVTNTSGQLKLNARSQALSGLVVAGLGTDNRVINGGTGTPTLTLNLATANVFSGVIGGPGATDNNLGLTKAGPGTLTLAGANTFTGATLLSAGAAVLAGSGTLASPITVNGATSELWQNSSVALAASLTLTRGKIGGSGTISSPGGVLIRANTVLSPGDGVGSQTYSTGLTWAPGGTYDWQISDFGGSWDTVRTSSLLISASTAEKFTVRIMGSPLAAPSSETIIPIATATDAINGFSASAFNLDATGFSLPGAWSLRQNSLKVELVFTPVPLPGAAGLALLGLGLAACRRRRLR